MIATVIICAALVCFVVLAVRSFRKTLRNGCCGAGGDAAPKKVRVGDRNPSHYPYEKILEIDGMTCRNCAARVQNALNSVDGVYAKVDLIKKEAVVHMKEKLPESLLRKAVSGAGYAVTAVHEESQA